MALHKSATQTRLRVGHQAIHPQHKVAAQLSKVSDDKARTLPGQDASRQERDNPERKRQNATVVSR
jgi:hypothetical protein